MFFFSYFFEGRNDDVRHILGGLVVPWDFLGFFVVIFVRDSKKPMGKNHYLSPPFWVRCCGSLFPSKSKPEVLRKGPRRGSLRWVTSSKKRDPRCMGRNVC